MKPLHIAVGVVRDAEGRILISERKADCAYAGQWEFPGGKVESGESTVQALRRELHEELGISITATRPLIRLAFEYPDRAVWLDTWEATAWQGIPESREGQRFAWVRPDGLREYPMLAANRPIVTAVRLPSALLVTPDPCEVQGDFLAALQRCLMAATTPPLVRLRAASLHDAAYDRLAQRCLPVVHQRGAKLLLDRQPARAIQLGADGWHSPESRLVSLTARPVPEPMLWMASCHSIDSVRQAQRLGADAVVLGAVLPTPSHPQQSPLGWRQFAATCAQSNVPVYAIGGMRREHLPIAQLAGGQGIAAIRGLWGVRG